MDCDRVILFLFASKHKGVCCMKQIIYESYLELLHLNEQKADSIQSLFGIYLNKDEPLDLLPGNMTSIHVIQCIGDHEPINHKGISRTMMISKANITKVTRKLQEDRLIRTVKLNDNKKEVYYKLTPEGRKVHDMHMKVHNEKKRAFMNMIEAFSVEEQRTIASFLEKMTESIRHEHDQL